MRTAQFKGHYYNFITGAHNATWLTFEDEHSFRDQYWNVRPGDVVYDVGAALGSYSLTALACGGIVHAFEPMRWEADILALSIKANPGFAERFTLHRVALSDEAKERLLGDEIFAHGSPKQAAYIAGNNEVVAFHRMDDYPTDRLDWVKIDVEGQELRVLKGGLETLKKHSPKLLIEVHLGVPGVDEYMRTNRVWEQIQELFQELGYTYTKIPYGGRQEVFAAKES